MLVTYHDPSKSFPPECLSKLLAYSTPLAIMTTRTLRLLEDHISEFVDPSTNEPIKFDKRYLLMEVTPPRDGWILVKAFFDKQSPPVWIPQRLVQDAQPGFYRVRSEIYWPTTPDARIAKQAIMSR